jgi:hypothetical protein
MEIRREVTIFSTFYKGQEEVNVLRTEELNRPESVNDDNKNKKKMVADKCDYGIDSIAYKHRTQIC